MKHTVIFRDAKAKGGHARFFFKFDLSGDSKIGDIIVYRNMVSGIVNVKVEEIMIEIDCTRLLSVPRKCD